MPLQAVKKVAIPPVSVPSFVFGSCTDALPTKPIILDPERPEDRFLTLASYRQWSQCLAKGLRNAGLQTGDRVLLVSGNSIAWPIPFMGTLMAGGVLTGVSPALPQASLLRLAKALEPSFILASEDGLANAKSVAQELGLPTDNVFLFDRECLFSDAPSTVENDEKQEKNERDERHENDEDNGKQENEKNKENYWEKLLVQSGEPFDWTEYASPDNLAVVNYTSGSTGFAKGVMVTHRNIVANAVQYMEQQTEDPWGPEHGIDNTWVMWAPFYHVIGQNQYCVIAPKRGISNYIMEKLALEPLLKYTEQYKPLTMLLMPPLLIVMLSSPIAKKYDLSSVRNVSVGGAPLRLPIVKRFEDSMPNPDCRVIQGWGMTEITCVVANRHPTDRETSQCIGQLLPNVEAKVMAPDGLTEVVGPHRSGELWIRSPNVTKGYWRDEERTVAMYMADGWLRTGDFGYYDEKERFFVSDRIQDIIYPASPPGAYVLPTDLESTLLDIPGVVDVGVTSVQVEGHSRALPRGFVVLDESKTLTKESVTIAFNEKVKPHEQLTGGVYVIKEIPKLPTGKVDRPALRAINIESL